jgi:hypothetical protein
MGLPTRRAIRRVAALAVVVVLLGLLAGAGVGASLALYTRSVPVAGSTVTTAASFDTTPPSISASVISKTTPYLPGYIRPSAAFYVYANVTDPGAGASGVATVRANVSSIKAGSTSVALVAGSYSVGGVAYNYRSASLTADAKAAGTYSYSITAVDNNANSANASFSVVVDSTVPTGTDVQTANKVGGTVGKAESGDTITFTFSETIDPASILSGWTGASTAVTVDFTNGGNPDSVTVWDGAHGAQLPLGSVNLGQDYVTLNAQFGGTMVESGATITVTLGTMTTGAVRTNSKAAAMVWTPSAAATDAAGNACSTTPTAESGTSDVDF